jgi:two-component system cell cycle response regulator DivK
MTDSARGRATTVLVIDDERLNRKLIRSLLGRERIEVLEAADAETGLALTRSAAPDLILLDIRLPGMGGLEALRVLKADTATREVPVLILSAGALAEDDDHFRRAGAAGLLPKPFSGAELKEAVRAALA